MYADDNQIDVLFFVEHKDRELETVSFIASVLKIKYGLKVGIGSLIFNSVSSVLLLRPKVIVTPSTSFGCGSVARNFYQVYGDQIKYVNLNFEQFLGEWNKRNKVSSSEFCLQSQFQFTWGEFFASFLESLGYEKNNITITGRPLYSIMQEKYNGQDQKHRDEIATKCNLDSNKIWNFIGFTDSLLFASESAIKNIIESGCEEEGLRSSIDSQEKCINTYLDWIQELDDRVKDKIEIIIRPHPSVSIKQYQNYIKTRLSKIPSCITLSKEFTAHKWLSACDNFYTNASTLSIESLLLKKNTYIIDPHDSLHTEKAVQWYTQDLLKIKTLKEFEVSLINKNKTEMGVQSILQKYIDLEKDGVKESANLIFQIQKTVPNYPRIDLKKAVQIFIESPQRTLGSILRLWLSKLRFTALIKSGIEFDYITKEIAFKAMESARFNGRSS